MKLSVHAVLVAGLAPETGVSGVLVFEEDGFTYVPLVDRPRGLAFANTLQGGLDQGTPPRRLLDYFFDKGGPHLHESLSLPVEVEAPTRLAALYQRAGEEGWVLDGDHRVDATPPPPPLPIPVPELPQLPRSLRQAMVLTTLSELYRRHHRRHELRLYEMHPGGGQYDCLTLMVGACELNLCCFNVGGSALLLKPLGRPRPPSDADEEWHQDVWRYPRAFVRAKSARKLADRLEARLGLDPPETAPAATASSISLAVMAELARRYALSDKAPHFRSGAVDTSGYANGPIQPWVDRFPKIRARYDAVSPWPDGALIANRLWGVDHAGRAASDPGMVVDMATGRVYRQGTEAGSLWTRYTQGEGLRSLAWWLERLWRELPPPG